MMMQQAAIRLSLGVLAVALGAGCGGALGQGSLQTQAGKDGQALNAPLAVGGSLQPAVDLSLAGTGAPTLQLISTRPSVLSVEDGRLTGKAPGVAAVLVGTQDGTILEFQHVWVERPTRATLHLLDAEGKDGGEVRGPIDLLIGESITLSPKVYHESQELEGVPPGSWSLDRPVAAVMRQGVEDRRRLVARAPGRANLRVSWQDVELVLPLEVLAPISLDQTTQEPQ